MPVFERKCVRRLQNGRLRRPSCAQVFARLCPGKPRHRADHTRARLLQKRIFVAGIEPELVCLLLPVLCARSACLTRRQPPVTFKNVSRSSFSPRAIL